MFSRIAQVTRHLSSQTISPQLRRSALSRMASADERNSRQIQTAACLIIGDEVLGGKVTLQFLLSPKLQLPALLANFTGFFRPSM
jgi:hypothetical protein